MLIVVYLLLCILAFLVAGPVGLIIVAIVTLPFILAISLIKVARKWKTEGRFNGSK